MRNVFSPIAVTPLSVGTTTQSYILNGNEFVDPMLKVKLRVTWSFNNQTPLQLQELYVFQYLIAANDEFTNTATLANYPVLGTSTDPGWFQVGNRITPTLNGNNVRILKRKRLVFKPQFPLINNIAVGSEQAVGTMSKTLSYTHKWRGKKTFEDDPANMIFTQGSQFLNRKNTLKGWNYYFLTGWVVPTYSLNSATRPGINMDTFLYFKDP